MEQGSYSMDHSFFFEVDVTIKMYFPIYLLVIWYQIFFWEPFFSPFFFFLLFLNRLVYM